MTGKELIKIIKDNKAEDSRVIIGCQGYLSEYNADDDVRAIQIPGTDSLIICDNCYYPEVDDPTANS
ncbi:MAG: hypothetical protein J5525_13315 [Lachnospiraceae bacterium]|nr:hypothetical protein [Lachnospiraceae bacterium]